MTTLYRCPHPGCTTDPTRTPDENWLIVRRVVDSEPLAPEEREAFCCVRHAIFGMERVYLSGVPL